MRRSAIVFAAAFAFLYLGEQSKSDIITFDDQGLTGPSTFSATSPMSVSVVSPGGVGVTFTGGTILTNTTALPADETSIYGTAGFASPQGPGGYENLITISFDQPIQNFIATLLNGSTITAEFQAVDGMGDTANFTLAPNLSGGQSQIAFAAAGNQVTITQLTNDPSVSGYDFFIDNIQFNVPLPGVPEPSSFLILASGGVAGLVGYANARQRRPRAA